MKVASVGCPLVWCSLLPIFCRLQKLLRFFRGVVLPGSRTMGSCVRSVLNIHTMRYCLFGKSSAPHIKHRSSNKQEKKVSSIKKMFFYVSSRLLLSTRNALSVYLPLHPVAPLRPASLAPSQFSTVFRVHRNDKSRICEPGSVRVLGRRQIEMYSRLIHTVDHVEG